MSLLDRLLSQGVAPPAADPNAGRIAEWGRALEGGTLPAFVTDRLSGAAAGRVPWLATMTPGELRLARSHGIRPVAMVSGTCWYHYGYSWTNGHAEGWGKAMARLKQEAVAAGANAIVDVKLRTIHLGAEPSMDYTVIGTAVRIDGLPPSRDPAVATLPALEFVRLLEAGIVPTGIAVGAHYDWLTPVGTNPTGRFTGTNMELSELSRFWDHVRKQAVRKLRDDVAAHTSNGVLAHTHFAQLLAPEGEKSPNARFLGRHIVIGTTVQCVPKAGFAHDLRTVVDMRDGESPLLREQPHGHTAYQHVDQEGSI